MRFPKELNYAGTARAGLAVSLAIAIVGSAQAATWCVRQTLPECTDRYESINDAIGQSMTQPGDTIKVAPGDYNELVLIPKRLYLRGAQAGVDARGRVGQSESNIVSSGGQFNLGPNSAGTVIDGFTFKGGSSGIQSQVVPLDDLQISNNRFGGFPGGGITLYGPGTDITIDKNVVDGAVGTPQAGTIKLLVFLQHAGPYDGLWLTNNEILNAGEGHGLFVFPYPATGILGPSSSRDPVIRGNYVAGNAIGVFISGSIERGWIADNRFVGNGANIGRYPALQATFVSTTIERNSFLDNGGQAIAPGNPSTGNTISDNEFRGSGGNGLSGGLISTTVTRNMFVANKGFAIGLFASAEGNTITANLMMNNGMIGMCNSTNPTACGGGISFGARDPLDVENDIFGNTISGNQVGAVYVGTNATQEKDARGNYWGAASGPHHTVRNPAGTGNAVIDQSSDPDVANPGEILFDPWLMLAPGNTPRTLTQAAAADVNALLPTGDKRTDKSLQKATDAILDSLKPAYWVGDFMLVDKGNKVFDEQKKAVKELEDVVKAGVPQSGAAQDAIEDLLVSEDVVARTAIKAAIAAAGKSAEIAKAQDAFARAQAAQAAGDWDKAVDDYKKSWEHATRAV